MVRPGERIPLDGIILKGSTSINQAPITGESIPVAKEPGDTVFAGTINGEGAIEFRSTKASSDTTLARIIHMVEEGQSRRAPAEQWVEKFARLYTPGMMILAVLVAVLPPLITGGNWAVWFYEALVILVIACPCSLVISTPVSIVAGLTSATRNGVLIKGGVYLEALAHIKAIAFDKTGTLTRGEPSVQNVIAMNDHTEASLLSRAAALESHSTHPLARAILNEAKSRGIEITPGENFTMLVGQGAQGTIDNRVYWIGSHRLLDQWQPNSPHFHEAAAQLEDAGHSLVVMWCDDHVCGLMSIADQVRSEAKSVVLSLKKLGIEKVVMITGDNKGTAEAVARLTGVDEYRAELLPKQ
jgi:Cd2+/Zn2+-exporting ATPase